MAALTEQQQRELARAVEEWRGRAAPRRGYPPTRKRIAPSSVGGFDRAGPGGLPPATTPPAALLRGDSVALSSIAGPGVTVVNTRGPVRGPFWVARIFMSHGAGANQSVAQSIKVATDNNTAAGSNETGVNIVDSFLANGFADGGLMPIEIFPNRFFGEGIYYFKAISVNLSLSQADFSYVIDLRYPS